MREPIPWVVMLALDGAELFLTTKWAFMRLHMDNPIFYADTKQHAERMILRYQDSKPGFTGRLYPTRAVWAKGVHGFQEWQTEDWFHRWPRVRRRSRSWRF